MFAQLIGKSHLPALLCFLLPIAVVARLRLFKRLRLVASGFALIHIDLSAA